MTSWISSVRPSRRPLRGLLRMTFFLNAIMNLRHPEEARSGRLEGRTQASGILTVGGFLYILLCRDGSYYVGSTSGSLEKRVVEHDTGTFDGYTAHRRPVRLVFQQPFESIEDAISAERQIKGWRRQKKEALIRGDFAALPLLASRAKRAEIEPPP